jgi:trehalose monomycolate/heme transporter
MTVRSPAYRTAVIASLARLPNGRVISARTYWGTGSPEFISASGHETFALLHLAGSTDSAKVWSFDAISKSLTARGLSVQAGGQIPTEAAINKEVTSDIGNGSTGVQTGPARSQLSAGP